MQKKHQRILKKQEELLSETLKKIDIIICTALIPGSEAPKIIKENMFKNLQSGSVIYDLAAVQGGNTVFTEVNKVVQKNGVKILGEANILNKLPISTSTCLQKTYLTLSLIYMIKKIINLILI